MAFLVHLFLDSPTIVMYKRIITLVFLLFAYIFTGSAQSLEYYIEVSKSSSNTYERLLALDSVVSKSFPLVSELFIEYSIKYADLAKEIDSVEAAATKVINVQDVLVNTTKNPKKAIDIINSVLLQKNKIKDSFLLGDLYFKKGKAYSKLDLELALVNYDEALLNFPLSDRDRRMLTYLYRGQANSFLGNVIAAGVDYNRAYSYYESIEDADNMLLAQQSKISMLSLHGFYDLARDERAGLIEKLIELDRTEILAVEFFNQSLDYEKTGNRELQIQFLLKADALQIDSKNDIMYINIHSKLLAYYSSNNELKKAREQLALLDIFSIQDSEDVFSELRYSDAKSRYLMAKGDLDASLDYAQITLKNAISLGVQNEIMIGYLLLSQIYNKNRDYKLSLENMNQYSKMRDSLYYDSAANSLLYYQSRFDIQEKEKERTKKTLANRLEKKDSETFNNLAFFVSLAIMLLFGIMLLYRNRQNLSNKKNLQEVFSQKLLVSQERERRRISKDLHDGIGQQLLLIKNKLTRIGDQETKEMVDITIDEIRNITRDLHPFALQELGITRAIEHTLQRIDENTTLFISSEVDNIDDLFSPEEEVNIYRIVQESLNNIIKHANAEASKVLVKRYAENITIFIKDNGVGFDFPEKYQDKKSLGLKTLLERTKFLKGQMKVVSKKENGTLMEFKFPIK